MRRDLPEALWRFETGLPVDRLHGSGVFAAAVGPSVIRRLYESRRAPVLALFLSDATSWTLETSAETGCAPAEAPGVAARVLVTTIKFELCGRQR